MKHFALVYDVVPNFVERRAPFRGAHLALLRDANARGMLLFAGPLGDPPDGALLVIRAESAAAVEDFARADPYVSEGLVTAWRVRPWNIVIGAETAASEAVR
jgi:uncharacterized protein YciI